MTYFPQQIRKEKEVELLKMKRNLGNITTQCNVQILFEFYYCCFSGLKQHKYLINFLSSRGQKSKNWPYSAKIKVLRLHYLQRLWGESVLQLFQLLEVIHIPWLVVPFQQWHLLSPLSLSLTLTLTLSFKDPCGYIEHTQIIKDKFPSSRPLN